MTEIKETNEQAKSNELLTWAEDQERLILYADIMGFKEFVRTNRHNVVKQQLMDFKKKWEKSMKPLLKQDYIRFVQYSDSILIVERMADNEGLNRISKAAAILMKVAMESGFGIKGCISQGILTFDKENELYFGQPLIDAYLLHEELHFYGIVIHHTAEQTVRDKNMFFYKNRKQRGNNPYIHSLIPLKNKSCSHYHLAWNLYDKKIQCPVDNTSIFEEQLEEIEKTISGAPRIYVDNTRNVFRKDKELWEKAKQKEEREEVKFPIREDELSRT